MTASINEKLQSSRKELLDIGLRNNMLNFRKTAKNLMIVDELSDEVLNILYRQEKTMSFAPLPDKKRAELTNALLSDDKSVDSDSDEVLLLELDSLDWSSVADDSALDENGRAKRHTDTKLQTALDAERLFLQLLKIHTEANGFIEEQGVNTLFIALGFLHWYESDSSENVRKAPLLLLPVSLIRGSAKEAFKLVYSGDEIVFNLSLAAKLKTDFGLDMNTCPIDEDKLVNDEVTLSEFYSDISDLISKQKRWKVAQNEIALGFFSFGKFLMFKDLDSKSWPDTKQPESNAVMCRLLGDGFGELGARFAEDVKIDSVIKPGDVRFVKDADSSQTAAILEVREGTNLVIQGPPGTGKSQTITNIIAELVGQGKSVLFVAEKMAALEVVKRRLDECHLGDAVLELHSHKSTKQSVLKELGKTLEQGQPLTQVSDDEMEELYELQEQLNQYCDAAGKKIGNSGLRFSEILGRYLKIKKVYPELPNIPFTPMSKWTLSEQQKRLKFVEELVLHLEKMGRPDSNVFWGSERSFFSPVEQHSATEALELALDELAHLTDTAEQLSERLMLSHPVTISDVGVVCRAAKRAALAPRLEGIKVSTNDWQIRRDAIYELLDAGEKMSECRRTYDDVLIEAAWEQDLLQVRQHLLAYGDKWWRFLSGNFRSAKNRLLGLMKGELPKSNEAMLVLVDSVLSYRQSKNVYDEYEALGAVLFGAQWQRQKSDWHVLRSLSNWIIELHDDLGKGEVPKGILTFLAGHSDASGLGEDVEEIKLTITEFFKAVDTALANTGLDAVFKDVDLKVMPLGDLRVRLESWLGNLTALYDISRFNVLSGEAKSLQLDDLLDVAISTDNPETLMPILDFSWYSGLVQMAYSASPELQRFDRIKHEHLINRFKILDLASLHHAQTYLAHRVWDGMPNINQPGEMAVLRTELNKKRRHIPIRQLMDRAGRAIQQIKPVFMMSPMSIANFLPPGKLEFDVVVFDEASQVKAVDAFGAILRGKQVVVVGDTRQMPPTDFFSRDIESDDENATADIESILSMFKVAGTPERYLRWHYRSRHESLIAVSNVEFYDSKLVVFPSAGQHPDAVGVSLTHLPNALYDRGRTRTNKEEAKAVAKAVIAHAKNTPRLSLGVAAFSVAQRDLIQIEIEIMRRHHPETEDFFNGATNEPFFIKNLENIQGDERDVIFISIGYGRNESGKIAREFGPLNREGGHRRLNVLITRAKLAMRVFSNFKADDLDLNAGANQGVRALKNFLKYAETRELEVARETGKSVDSPFEQEVIDTLRDRNYEVEPQVGTAGYFIDIAVRDPDYPGRYVLAIECDGASYHSSQSARDRDRLRQGVLEGLGWSFHRIWSTDWFRNPKQEIERAVEAIEAARQKAFAFQTELEATEQQTKHEIIRDEVARIETETISIPYEKVRLPSPDFYCDLHEEETGTLMGMIKSVVDGESPVHINEVTRRLLEAYGVGRAGRRIVEAVRDAVDLGLLHGHIVEKGEFLYSKQQQAVPIRNRSHMDSADKKFEWIAPEELEQALLDTVRLGFSMSWADATSGALNMLGFSRATARISSIIEDRIHSLVSERRLVNTDDVLSFFE